MKEHYVSYECAVKLKEYGFDEPCEFYYNPYQELRISKDCLLSPKITNNRFLEEIADGMATAPRLDQAAAWLRDKGIYVEPRFQYESAFKAIIQAPRLHKYMVAENIFNSFEQALSVGLDVALELLGKEVSNGM